MRRLMLLRHARTESDAPSGKDWDRHLDARGRTDAADVGAWLARYRHLPDLVLVSTAIRARETWDILSGIVWNPISGIKPAPTVLHLDELYGAELAQLLQIIRAVATENPKCLLIVGHNPGLYELALGLIGGGNAAGRKALADNLPTSGTALIDFAIENWNDVSFRGGQLELFVSPKLLKEA